MASYNGKNWCGTINNFEDSAKWPDGPQSWLRALVVNDIATYAVGQIEEGEEEHTRHLQCFLQLKDAHRLTWLKRHVHDGAHWEPMRGTAIQASEYCKKEATRVQGPWEFGILTKHGKTMGLDEAIELVMSGAPLRQVIEQFPRIWVQHGRGLSDLRQRLNLDCDRRVFGPEGPEVWVLYGPSGTGKSRFVAERWPDAFWKIPGEKWWDGYDRHETVVLDDFKDASLSLTDMQRLLDRYPLWVEVKGGAVPMLAKRYVITSNSAPETWYLKSDQHKTVLRRVRDYAEQYGRLLYVGLDWVPPPPEMQRSLGNTRPNSAAEESASVADEFDRLVEHLHD